MSIIDILKANASDYGIEINQDLAEKLEIYGKLLKEWNDKINLTAIKDDEGIAVKHFLDCLLVSKVADFKDGMSVIDVGTGAGFPGLVIAAAYPNVDVTLLDSTGKKLKAVADMAQAMENVQFLTVFYGLCTLLISYKLLKKFKLTGFSLFLQGMLFHCQ